MSSSIPLPAPAPLPPHPQPERIAPPAHALCDTLVGDGPAAQNNRALLGEGKARVVVTGQQPAFPLPLGLTLFKIATAVALAGRLTARTGERHVPLFWSGSDDSDFDEARGQWLPRGRGGWARVDLAGRLHSKGRFVGDLDIAPAWRELRPLLPEPVRSEWSPSQGVDLGRCEAAILARLFADAGLLVLDAREDAVRRSAAPLFARYLKRRAEFAARLDAAGDDLERASGARPLRRGLGERALFFLKRRRRNLPEAEIYAAAAREKLRREPASLSPNAALRPLAQDFILPVAAAVLGPGEWAYHRQLHPLFTLMELPFPPAIPRLEIERTGEADLPFPPGGRASSPLASPGDPLADPAFLAEAAARHLDLLAAGRRERLILER